MPMEIVNSTINLGQIVYDDIVAENKLLVEVSELKVVKRHTEIGLLKGQTCRTGVFLVL